MNIGDVDVKTPEVLLRQRGDNRRRSTAISGLSHMRNINFFVILHNQIPDYYIRSLNAERACVNESIEYSTTDAASDGRKLLSDLARRPIRQLCVVIRIVVYKMALWLRTVTQTRGVLRGRAALMAIGRNYRLVQ